MLVTYFFPFDEGVNIQESSQRVEFDSFWYTYFAVCDSEPLFLTTTLVRRMRSLEKIHDSIIIDQSRQQYKK